MIIREAREADLLGLERVAPLGGSLHRDRITPEPDEPMRVLVAEDDGAIMGYAFLVLTALSFWTPRYVPQLVDLQVRDDRHGRGYGTALIRATEALVRAQGSPALYLAVDPDDNPRALALYLRLGYVVLDPQPVDEPWAFTDSSGVEHSGVDHVIYLARYF